MNTQVKLGDVIGGLGRDEIVAYSEGRHVEEVTADRIKAERLAAMKKKADKRAWWAMQLIKRGSELVAWIRQDSASCDTCTWLRGQLDQCAVDAPAGKVVLMSDLPAELELNRESIMKLNAHDRYHKDRALAGIRKYEEKLRRNPR